MDGAIFKLATGEIPGQQDDGHEEERTSSDHTRDQRSVNLFDWAFVSGHIRVVEAFARATSQRDALVPENATYHPVKSRFFKVTLVDTAILLQTFESSRSSNFFLEEVGQINGTIGAAEELVLNTATLDVGTFVESAVLI